MPDRPDRTTTPRPHPAISVAVDLAWQARAARLPCAVASGATTELVEARLTDEGEDLEAALIRETREEIDLRLRRDAVRMVTSVHYLNPEGHARIGFFFHALTWDGEPRNAEPHKCARIDWFPIDQLPDNTVPYSHAGVELYRRGEPFGLQGWPHPADVLAH